MPPPSLPLPSRASSQSKRRRNLLSVELTEAEITNERLRAKVLDLRQRKEGLELQREVDRLQQEVDELEEGQGS
jgi:hypothetical protein